MSGYYVACRLHDDTNGREESSEQRHDHNIWKQLWQLHVPSKIKVFGWRACLNILPSKVNLVRRHVLQEDKCDICQRCSESIIHALWDCGGAQDVWAGSIARIQKSGGKVDDFLQLFQVMMAKLSMEELEIFLVRCWLIWHRRNTVVHGGTMQHPRQLNQRVADLLTEYQEAQSSLAVPLSRPCFLQNWKPPAGQLFKLNFDAAIFNDGSGVGAVIRNAAGEVMAALSARGDAMADSEEAEVRACRKALEFAIDAGF